MVNLDSRIHLTKRILVVYEMAGSYIITSPFIVLYEDTSICSHQLKKVRKLERETRRVDDFFEGRGAWVFDDFLFVREILFVRKIVLCCLNLQEYSKIFCCVQRIFCFNSSNKLLTTLDKTFTDRTDPVSRLTL